jgi:hypothetical protein
MSIRILLRVMAVWVVLNLLSAVSQEAIGEPAAAVPAAAVPAAHGDGQSHAEAKPAATSYGDLLKNAVEIGGLVKLHRKEEKLLAELTPNLLDRDFIVLIAIARGIGEGRLLGGMNWEPGDDWLWQFRKTDERIQIVRRNVRFTATKGSPEERAVKLAYTDSVLFSLPIAATSPGGAYVVDLSPVFMSDLPKISAILEGFTFSREKSNWASVKGFKDNVEIEVAATYSSNGSRQLDTVPDSRGATINVHYSLSLLPETGYQPRLADDRVGYFPTVLKDYSRTGDEERFVRYVNRWDLRKADPAADLSPPKKPIIFWLEKTIPFECRKPIREGILEWNKAFEKIGLANAIEVRQQPDEADWDPEDVNYNTFRWITSSAGFAMGPSRVNPITGEILDADVIFDADFLQYWRWEYEVGHSGTASPAQARAEGLEQTFQLPSGACPCPWHCTMSGGMANQLALGAIALADVNRPASKEQIHKLIDQALKFTVMHELGHTLGLRHNFQASTMLTLEELNDPAKTASTGLAASVMDYLPINFVPKGQRQGDYFSTTIGPYDYWAIEYGYKPLSGNTHADVAELKRIASRGSEPALAFATDEDLRSEDPDPLVNTFDLGKDPLQFARWRASLVHEILPTVVDRITADGDTYDRARRAFNVLLAYHGTGMHVAARFIGGVYVHRDHKGDPGNRPPLAVVEAARQREALALLKEEVFGPNAYQLPTELLNRLAPPKWVHWGTRSSDRVDYPVHDVILGWQDRILSQLLSSQTLTRLVDSELKVPADQDAFTAADLIHELSTAVYQEVDKLGDGKFTNRKPAISSLRRNLQRRYFERLATMALGQAPAPADCVALANLELEGLESRIKASLAGKAELDVYTQSHLKDLLWRIQKVRDARLPMNGP